jgi:glycosyltransferase
MKHIYLFNEGVQASMYGIGSYIKQMIDILHNVDDISLNIVQLHSDEIEFRIIKEKNINIYLFPSIETNNIKQSERYYRNIFYILSEFIKIKENDALLFHLNYHRQYHFVKIAKYRFNKCKIIHIIHYIFGELILKGNTTCFQQFLNSENSQLDKYTEELLSDSYEIESKLFKEADKLICLSNHTKEMIPEIYHIQKDKSILIYNGIDDYFTPVDETTKRKIKEELYLSSDENLILFTGRLDTFKGVDHLIKSFKIVLEECPNCRLLLVGDGNFSIYLKILNPFWDRVTITGKIDKDLLYKFYQVCDIGVLPSLNEQCSYVAIEMLMFGIPIIASTSTGLKEMIEDNISGIQIPVIEDINGTKIDSEFLAEKIICLLKNPGKCNDLRLNARKRYENTYTSEILKKKMLALYNSFSIE